MADAAGKPSTTRAARLIRAPRSAIYRAFVDADVFGRWLPPAGMTGTIHELDPRPGGHIRLSLTYDDPTRAGKTEGSTDTVRGRFVELVADQKIVQAFEFESADAGLGGEMTMTTLLADAAGGTQVSVLHENLPPGVRPEDDEMGMASSLANLAALLE